MNNAGLRRPSYRRPLFSLLAGLFLFLALFPLLFCSRYAYAEGRRYDLPSAPTMTSPKEQIIQNVNYLCEASKSDLGRYSDRAISRWISRFGDADAVVLYYYNLFGLKELNSVRARLIRCQSVFIDERHKRRLRADSGLEKDIKAALPK